MQQLMQTLRAVVVCGVHVGGRARHAKPSAIIACLPRLLGAQKAATL
jgi:hypothetical protein